MMSTCSRIYLNKQSNTTKTAKPHGPERTVLRNWFTLYHFYILYEELEE